MSLVPYTTATILWTSLPEGYYSTLVWFMSLLASFMSWWVDEKMKKALGLQFLLIIQARVTAVSVIEPVMMIWFHQAVRIKKTVFQWVQVVSQRSSFIVGFLTQHAKGLSSFPTLDTERMWRCKAWPPHRSHCDLGAWYWAKRPAQRPHWEKWFTVTSAIWNWDTKNYFNSPACSHPISILIYFLFFCPKHAHGTED